jgi:phosphate transport system protein
MTHSSLDREIKLARAEILFLGSMIEQAMLQSIIALRDHDMECSKVLLGYDYRINTERFSLEGIIAIIATQQPMAHDLRVLAAILDGCIELERIGDYAKDTSLRSIYVLVAWVAQGIAKISITWLRKPSTCYSVL